MTKYVPQFRAKVCSLKFVFSFIFDFFTPKARSFALHKSFKKYFFLMFKKYGLNMYLEQNPAEFKESRQKNTKSYCLWRKKSKSR